MVRNIDDVKTELRKLTNSKPVHAVAGAGVLASQALKELPWRLVQWTRENPPDSLPGRANGYVQTARTRAAGGYDRLAEHGKKALNGQTDGTRSQSTTQTEGTTQSKSELNGKPKAKAPSRTRTGN